MTKTKVYRLATLMLVLTLISTVMISGTFAKYTSTYAGQDTALVARWSFGVKEGDTELGAPDDTPIKQLDLFKHNYITHINQKAGDDYIIAPGVNDDFTISMTFLSDVDAKVTVDFGVNASSTEANLPIEYLVDGDTKWVSVSDLEKAFVAQVVANSSGKALAAENPDNTFTFVKSGVDDTSQDLSRTVSWRWAFDGYEQSAEGSEIPAFASNDVTDTGFGKASAVDAAGRTTYILDISIKAEQIEIEPLTTTP